jgi:hypothetical protein
MRTALNGHHTPAHRSATGATGGFHRGGLDARQASGLGDECRQLLLLGQDAAQHVAEVERCRSLERAVLDRGADRAGTELADFDFALLAHRGLADASDIHVPHIYLRASTRFTNQHEALISCV